MPKSAFLHVSAFSPPLTSASLPIISLVFPIKFSLFPPSLPSLTTPQVTVILVFPEFYAKTPADVWFIHPLFISQPSHVLSHPFSSSSHAQFHVNAAPTFFSKLSIFLPQVFVIFLHIFFTVLLIPFSAFHEFSLPEFMISLPLFLKFVNFSVLVLMQFSLESRFVPSLFMISSTELQEPFSLNQEFCFLSSFSLYGVSVEICKFLDQSQIGLGLLLRLWLRFLILLTKFAVFLFAWFLNAQTWSRWFSCLHSYPTF